MHGQLQKPTVGSLFAGIGGFDIGFENAGFQTAWQVEINPVCRAVLADRFPQALQFNDVRAVHAGQLPRVDVIVGGFPCQDLSTMGKRQGLAGERSGLFYEVVRLARELQPRWLVLENVTGLLSCNHGEDFQTVISTLAECGYLGCWRVLNAQYFGVPTKRRRVFIVAGFHEHPPVELLVDAAPVGAVHGTAETGYQERPFATLLAGSAAAQIDIGGASLVVESNGWDQMVERARASTDHGFLLGLDEANFAETRAAGNAVVPQVVEWVAKHLRPTFQTARLD
ncbi:DNA cytosine methyltransferase [Chromobacterium haemolyticum]|uniref:Cytosine-specific methyltransferase n=1 Tax=Chromobacterium fluminis TaxID=3044269 RepID=A0ABX0L8T0_9NEIS|nr:DNA cytosine methyltransferase [Chromobacterium haemolyticum]NHR08029.1 DNA cytosine methyltransferase [Chromobacterium haemolyticum]